jgi:hypothetical protein
MRILIAMFLLYSCGDKGAASPTIAAESSLKLVHSPATQYPSVDYDEVALYSVHARHYKEKKLRPLKEEDHKKLEGIVGFAILDSTGSPVYKNVEKRTLTQTEKQELRSIFYLPENNGKLTENRCIAYYRDAFVFYHNKKQVAQAQVCFECRQVQFSADTANLAERFASDGDWTMLQRFISRIKNY